MDTLKTTGAIIGAHKIAYPSAEAVYAFKAIQFQLEETHGHTLPDDIAVQLMIAGYVLNPNVGEYTMSDIIRIAREIAVAKHRGRGGELG